MSAGADEVIPLHPAFETVFRGFRPQQVIEYIESLEGEISLLTADRDHALEQAGDLRKLLDHVRREWEEARRRLERKPPTAPSGLPAGVTSERLHQMVVLAEAEASAIRERAEEEALATRAEAQRRIDEAFETLAEDRAALEQRGVDFEEEMRAEREKAAADGRAVIAKAEAEGDRLQKQAVAKCARLEAESESRRSLADQEHERKLARRLDETAKDIAERERRHEQKISTVLSLVAWETDRRLTQIAVEREELISLQERLTAQLAEAHTALGAAVERISGRHRDATAQQAVEHQAAAATIENGMAAATGILGGEPTVPMPQTQEAKAAVNGSAPATWAVAGGS